MSTRQRIKEVISQIELPDEQLMEKAQARLDNLTKPLGSLGKLEELAKRVVGVTRNPQPVLNRKVIFTLAADHGVVEEGVSAYPSEVTAQMVYNFLRGGAGINVLAKHIGAEVVVVDIGVKEELKMKNGPEKFREFPGLSPRNLSKIPEGKLKIKKISQGTKNMAKGPAMSQEEAIKSIEAGIGVFEEAHKEKIINICGVGDMGIGNTTASSAIVACITGQSVAEVTSYGTGINDQQLEKKVEVVKKALQVNKPDPESAIDVLSKVGGYEIGGIAGIILAAAANKVPVVIDGFISTAGALIAYKLSEEVAPYMFASHQSCEKGHQIALSYMGKSALLNLSLRLGEGTGATLAINLIEAGCKILNEMATFGEAGVSTKE